MTGVHGLDHAAFLQVAEFVRARSGIILDESKAYLIETRLGPLLDELKADSYLDLCRRAASDPPILNRLLDEISTNETSFFRDSSPFDLLKFKLLPDLMDRRGQDRDPISIWSAASSTGQEVYSIAITCREILPREVLPRLRIVGTDLSQAAVERASRGEYSSYELERGTSAEQRSRFFHPEGSRWRVNDELRAMTSFRQLNLLESLGSLGSYDIIFCRNVAIYFDLATRRDLFARISRLMKPGAALVIGSSETLHDVSDSLERLQHMRCAYYRVRAPVSGR